MHIFFLFLFKGRKTKSIALEKSFEVRDAGELRRTIRKVMGVGWGGEFSSCTFFVNISLAGIFLYARTFFFWATH